MKQDREMVALTVVSVNVASPEKIHAKSGITGIFKCPQSNGVQVSTLGLKGDTIIDQKDHGGVDQAVYIYCKGDYDWWEKTEGFPVHAGLFGENITVDGMTSADAHVGARLIAGQVVLEITSHRTPCSTLAARMQDSGFAKRFWSSKRTGFYCRVIQEGLLSPNSQMQLFPFEGEIVTIADLIDYDPYENIDEATCLRLLSSPIHHKLRGRLLQIAESQRQ